MRTISISKFKNMRSNSRWKNRIQTVNEVYEKASETGQRLRLFKIMDLLDANLEDKTLAAAVDPATGERVENLTALCDLVLDHCDRVLTKEDIPPYMRETYLLKQQIINEHWTLIKQENRVITWRQFMKATYKIYEANKAVYQDFINSGTGFKYAVFLLINKIYQSGEIPKSFHETFLSKIYKKKGSVSDLNNYRFIHSKPGTTSPALERRLWSGSQQKTTLNQEGIPTVPKLET